MTTAFDHPIFVGCATDHKFVGPTTAMLSSLDDNGDVPECIILVADFGLTAEDRSLIRDSAGALGGAMRFVAVEEGSAKIVAMPRFGFPLPLLGRLILPGEIDAPGARLLLIDSDIVVNHSLRPLFAIDMLGRPLAAAQDPLMKMEYEQHRKRTSAYFNAGLMLLDLDKFNGWGLGEASMRKLAAYEHPPVYFDQCAMNELLEGEWVDIDRAWNFFQTGYDHHFEREKYEAAHVVHFAGPKPWVVDWHPATPLWTHHMQRARQKAVAWRNRVNERPADRRFIAMQHEVLLGHEPESGAVDHPASAMARTQITAAVIGSDEFRDKVLEPLARGTPIVRNMPDVEPTLAYRLWAADELAILPVTAKKVLAARSWRALLGALAEDERLMATAGIRALSARPVADPSPPAPSRARAWMRLRS